MNISGNGVEAARDKYFAFISYSHSDEKWGRWLHKRLERYRVPRRLVGTQGRDGSVERRVFPVFRDREELPTSSDLGATIQDALEKSRYLIVICSPRSASSRWVNEEILSYKRLGRANRILCLIIDGEPGASDMPGREGEECFPPAVRFRLGADGALSNILEEPIAADARPGKDGRQNAFLKLAAGVLGVDYDSLKQRDAIRRRNTRLTWATTAVVAVAVATFAIHTNQKTRWEGMQQAAIAGAGEAQEALARGDTRQGLELATMALPATAQGREKPITAVAVAALRRAVSMHRALGVRPAPDYDWPTAMLVTARGELLIADQSGDFTMFHGDTGAEIRRHVPAEPVNSWALSADGSTYWAAEHGPETQRADRTWFAPLRLLDIDLLTGDVVHDATVETDGIDRGWSAVTPDGKFLVKDVTRDGRGFLRVWDRYSLDSWDIASPDFSAVSEAYFLGPSRLLVMVTPPQNNSDDLSEEESARVLLRGPGAFILNLATRETSLIRDPSDPFVCPTIAGTAQYLPPLGFRGEGPAPLPAWPTFGNLTGTVFKAIDGGQVIYAIPPGVQGYRCIMRWQIDDPTAPQTAFELANAQQILQVFPELPALFEAGGFHPPQVFQKWYSELTGADEKHIGFNACEKDDPFSRRAETALCGTYGLRLVFGEGESSVQEHLKGHTASVRLLAINNAGDRGYSLARDGTIRAWDTAARHSFEAFERAYSVRSTQFGARLVLSHGSSPILSSVLDANGVALGPAIETPTEQYLKRQLVADGQVLAIFAWERAASSEFYQPENILRLVRVADGMELARFERLISRYGAQPLLSAGGGEGVVVRRDGTAVVFSTLTGSEIAEVSVTDRRILDAAFADEALFVLASDDNEDIDQRRQTLFRFALDTKQLQEIETWPAIQGNLLAAPNGSRILIDLDRTHSAGELRLLFDPITNKLMPLEGLGDDIFESVFSADGTRLIVAQTGKAITAYDTETGRVHAAGQAQSAGGYAPQLDPAGRFAFARPAEVLALIPLQTEFPPCNDLQGVKADAATISGSGRHLALHDSWENQITVYSLDACTPVAVLPVDPIDSWDMAFHGDEALIVIVNKNLVTRWPLYASIEAAMTRAAEMLGRPVFGETGVVPEIE